MFMRPTSYFLKTKRSAVGNFLRRERGVGLCCRAAVRLSCSCWRLYCVKTLSRIAGHIAVPSGVSQIVSPHEKIYPLWNLYLQSELTFGAHKRASAPHSFKFIPYRRTRPCRSSGPSLQKRSQATLGSTSERRQKSQNASPLICITTGLEQSWRWINMVMTQCSRPIDECYVSAVLWMARK